MLSVIASAMVALISQAASPAVVQAAPAMGPAPAVAAATPGGEKQVCRYEAETGSNFRKKTCHTADEWAQMAADSRASVEKMQQNNGFTH